MLIVKTFRDYYDGVANLGVDLRCVYDRKTSYQDCPLEHYPNNRCNWNLPQVTGINVPIELNPFIVGFCGKFYLGYEVVRDIYKAKETAEFLYIENDLHLIDHLIKEYFFRSGGHYSKVYGYKKYLEGLKRYNKTDCLSLNHTYKSPVFIINWGTLSHYRESPYGRKEQVIINPCLKNYHFFKVKDTFSAYQEIYQIMSGVLARVETPIVEISEKDKLVQHGMDKWSFRNPDPPKRKQK